jgi:hypothetical protein
MKILILLLPIVLSSDLTGLILSGSNPLLLFNQSISNFNISLQKNTLLLGNCIEYEVSENIYLNLQNITGQSTLEIDDYLSFDGINQWKLAYTEDFSNPTGWSDNTNTNCGGLYMLGGYCEFSSTAVSKTFDNLPSHSSLKVMAVFHFMDTWNGGTGYLKIRLEGNDQYVWTESYKAGQAGEGIDACGDYVYEGKFSFSIEVIVPHTDTQAVITFGALVDSDDDSCDESWGISTLELYLK